MGQIRYLAQRRGVYQYRRWVPPDVRPFVGTDWWKVSLGTGARGEAETRSRKLAVEHDLLIAQVRGMTDRARYKELSAKALSLRREIVAEMGRRIDAGIAAIERGEMAPDPAMVTASRAEVSRLQVQHAPIDKAASVAFKMAEVAMLAEGVARGHGLQDHDRQAVAAAGGVEALYRRAKSERCKIEGERSWQKMRQAVGLPTTEAQALALEVELAIRERKLAEQVKPLAPLGIEALGAAEDPQNPRINTAIEKWFEDRKQGPSAVNRHRTSTRRFVELHGNVPVRSITKPMVREYLKKIETLADHRRLPTAQRGGLADPGSDVPRVAAPTVERHLASIKAMLKFCIEQDWIAVNVATGLKGPKDIRPKAAKRRSFSRDERRQVLARAMEEQGENGDLPWLIRLGGYTGARLEELGQLARTNVRQIDGVWIVEIDDLDGRHIKTNDSAKQLPLHPAIRDEFVAWVQKGKGEHVFASFERKGGRFGNKLSGEFGRLMDRAGLSDPRLVFHSFRHTLKREMSNARIDPDVRRVILGHAPKDAHDGYAGHSLEAVAAEFALMPPLF